MSQPELVTAYANLADAYLLTGDRERATTCLEHAKEWIDAHDDWYMTVVYLLENASRALTTGNVPLALSIKREVDSLTGGNSQQLHVQGGLSVKLDVLRALHEQGKESARRLAIERKQFFKDRVPAFYLDALAVSAWIEKLSGKYSAQTEEELKFFDSCGAVGKRALLQAQGFLV